MVTLLAEKCGILWWPQLALNIAVLAIVIGYSYAWWRREIPKGQRPWEARLDPLANVAVAVGLLGSVQGFIMAYDVFQKGVEVSALAHGLSVAYWTTGVGLITSLTATLGTYLLDFLNGAWK
jgi:hypothetical protein